MRSVAYLLPGPTAAGGVQLVGRAGAADGGKSGEHLPTRWGAHYGKNFPALRNPFGDRCCRQRGQGILAADIQNTAKRGRKNESVAGLAPTALRNALCAGLIRSRVCGGGLCLWGFQRWRRGVDGQARGNQRTLSFAVRA